jgi:hypothetical protein
VSCPSHVLVPLRFLPSCPFLRSRPGAPRTSDRAPGDSVWSFGPVRAKFIYKLL